MTVRTAVVLVGGFGTRLRPLTYSTPKQMLPVVDRPMIEHVLGALARHGIERAVLAVGYKPDAFWTAYPDSVIAGVQVTYSIEDEPLDTAGAIGFAARAAGIDETFLVVNGDVLTDLDVSALVAFHESRSARATIHLVPVDDPSRYGVVPTEDDGRVLGFVEKPPSDQAPTNWINAGTYVLEPDVIDLIPVGRRASIERETFPTLAAAGSLYAYQSDVYWIDTGTPATYLQAQLDLIAGRRGSPMGGVARDSVIDPSATVTESVVMSGARLGAGARVERSVLLPGAVVAAGGMVVGSIVGPRARVGEGAIVDQMSVIGDGVKVAPGDVVIAARIPLHAD